MTTHDAFSAFIESDAYNLTRLPAAPPVSVLPPDDVAFGNYSGSSPFQGLTPERVGEIDIYAADKHRRMLDLPEAKDLWMPMIPPEDAYHAVAMARHLADELTRQLLRDAGTTPHELAIYAAFYFLVYYNWNGRTLDDDQNTA